MNDLGWRYFRLREIREAKLWAAAGGIAVHDNEGLFPYVHRWRGPYGGKRVRTHERTAHLLARDARDLIAAGDVLGLKESWLQRDARVVHYDLFGAPLRKAVEKCPNAPLRWPALISQIELFIG